MFGPIFRPDVIAKVKSRMVGSANQRQNPSTITGRGRPTTGANATATTNPTGATTLNAGSYQPPMGMSKGPGFDAGSYVTPQNIGSQTQFASGIRGGGLSRSSQSPAEPRASGQPSLQGGLGFGGIMARGGAVAQHPMESQPFVNAGTPQFQSGGMKMGGNEDFGSYEGGIFYGADTPSLPQINMQDPQYRMQGFDMAGNPTASPGGGLGPFVDSARAYSDPQNPRLVEPDMSGAPKVDYFDNRNRRPRQIDRPLTPREAQDVNTEMAGTRELTGQMQDFVAQQQMEALQGRSPLRPADPQMEAMEAESRRISRQGSILENTPIATDSFGATQNGRNLPSDMRNSVTTGPANGFNGNIGYANSPDRATPDEIQASARASAEAQSGNRVREGNDAFGDRFRGGALNDYIESGGKTWQEREKDAEFAADAPRRANARAVADQMKADLAAQRAANPEAEYARKLSIAQASADREAKHNAFKEQTGGLNYKQFDRLTRKTDLIEKKVGQGRITREEADRQIENETLKQGRRADGASGVASERLRRVESQKPMDRTRLPNGSLPEATRMKAEQTANQLTDPNYTKGSPEFNQSREVLSSVGIDSADSAASASTKIASSPFPLEDPESARRAAMAYRMYWGSKKDASKDWTKDESWGLPGFASERTDPQFAKMMEELTSTPTSEIDAWIEKYSGHLAMFGQDKSKYDALTKPKHNMTELNQRLPENASPFPGRIGGY